jgi:predicted RNase H-like HicB family nuclease
MAREFSAIYEQDGDWWIGRTEEVRGAFGQGHTLDEARESLREAIELILDVRREQGLLQQN